MDAETAPVIASTGTNAHDGLIALMLVDCTTSTKERVPAVHY